MIILFFELCIKVVDPDLDVEDMMRAPRPAIPIIHIQGPSNNRIDGGGGSSFPKPTTQRPRCTGLCTNYVI